jgi:hypothetical protein
VTSLKRGDVVTHVTMGSRDEFRLGIVLREESALGLIKVLWCDQRISMHVRIFLKRIA